MRFFVRPGLGQLTLGQGRWVLAGVSLADNALEMAAAGGQGRQAVREAWVVNLHRVHMCAAVLCMPMGRSIWHVLGRCDKVGIHNNVRVHHCACHSPSSSLHGGQLMQSCCSRKPKPLHVTRQILNFFQAAHDAGANTVRVVAFNDGHTRPHALQVSLR